MVKKILNKVHTSEHEFFKVIRFGFVGVLNTFIYVFTFNLLVTLNTLFTQMLNKPEIMNGITLDKFMYILFNPSQKESDITVFVFFVIASAVSIVNSFFFNKAWTFNKKQSISRNEVVKFLIVNAGYMIITYLITNFINGDSKIGLRYAQIIATIIALPINFIGYRFWVFKRSNDKIN
jgi:putative flippase GtrA